MWGAATHPGRSRRATFVIALVAGLLLATPANAAPSAGWSFRHLFRSLSTRDRKAPTPPTGFVKTGATATSISVSWRASTDNVGVGGYDLYKKKTLVAKTVSTTYTFTGLACGTTYTLAVDAYDLAGNRSTKASLSASTAGCAAPAPPPPPPIDTQPPSAPTGLAASGATASSITLTWSPASDNVGVAGYGLYQNGTRSGSTSATSFTFGGLACGSAYTLAVDAYDAAGNRSAQSSLSASTSACSAGPGLYWGAWIGSQFTGTEAPWDMNAVSLFEQGVGKKLSLLNFSSPFANCYVSPCSFYAFPTAAMEAIRQHGAIPFFSWASDSLPVSTNEPNFQLADVTAGAYDSYIRSFASAAKSWGHPFFLRFNWEMNGNWFPWAERANGNQPGDYVAAWRHVHDLFAAVGATNVSWVWCPNIDPYNQQQPLAGLYPGDAYVDWTCLDGYNWGNPWASFDQLYRASYTAITSQLAPSKPLVIGEVASTEQGGSKAAWITDMLSTQLPQNYPKVKGFLWFDKYDSGMDWPLETSGSAKAAFASGIQSSLYATNSFAALNASPIPPAG